MDIEKIFKEAVEEFMFQTLMILDKEADEVNFEAPLREIFNNDGFLANDAMMLVLDKFNLELDYLATEELELFETIEDIGEYIVERITGFDINEFEEQN